MSIRRATERELRRHQSVLLLQNLLALAPVAAALALLAHVLGHPEWTLPGLGVLVLGVSTATRVRRPSARVLLQRIDPSECLLTAYALEEAGDHEGLAALVHDRAGSLRVRLPMPWRVPRHGLLAALVLAVVAGGFALDGGPIEDAQAAEAPPALDAEAREKLARQAERIAELQRIPHLTEAAREELQRAQQELAKARTTTDPTQAQGALSRAERSLSKLGHEDAPFFENDALDDAHPDDIATALAEAMQRGDTALAKQLADEAAERMSSTPAGQDLGELSDALSDAMAETGAADPRALSEHLARTEGRPSDQAVREMMAQLREAREGAAGRASESEMAASGAQQGKQGDSRMGSKGDGGEGRARQGEGEGEGPGEQGPADSPGMLFASMTFDGGAPGTGGPGDREPSGDGDAGVRGAGAEKSWIQGQWEQGPQVLLGSLEGRAKGYEDPETWAEVHRSYAAVAEEVAEHEQLPLSRRDYVRDYFHAIRPR